MQDPLLDGEHLVVHRPRVLGPRECKHLDLGELVDAVQALALASVSTRLGAEAVRQTRELDRKIVLVHDRVGVHPAEGDLGRPDQAQVVVRDRVDLRLFATRVVADAGDDLGPRDVGRSVQCEALALHRVESEALQGMLEQHGLVLEEVPLLARDLPAALEVDEIELRGDLEVIPGR